MDFKLRSKTNVVLSDPFERVWDLFVFSYYT
ncbi:hypothetical protein DET49_12921 [Salegentibacter sp. 24]|nr:hypothetical protein DET49_12921 [Salegentibacter sp. 24]